jgi:hypothetical protein
LTNLQRQHETEQERVVREAEERGRQEIRGQMEEQSAQHTRELVTSRVIAAAAGKLRDPELAGRLVDVGPMASEADPAKREALIGGAIDALIKERPYLASDGHAPSKPQPLVTPGPRSQPADRGARRREGRAWLRP